MMHRSVKFILIICCIIFQCNCQVEAQDKMYAVAEVPTPVFNVSDLSTVFGGGDGKTLHLDSSGLLRELEFIALPETVFLVKDVIENKDVTIYEVTTNDYPYPSKRGYFIDSRFVKIVDRKPRDRFRELPSRETIIDSLISSKGNIYVWGGNCRQGVPEMLDYYPPERYLSPRLKKLWMLKGLDCSGLLYQATNGFTPRNTGSLVSFGRPVNIGGLYAEQISRKVKPLDLIVWKGHVIIVLDDHYTIESRLGAPGKGEEGGVVVRDLKRALEDLCRKRMPVDNYNASNEKRFVVRRWYR